MQLLHPVLTLGLLVRARLGLCSASPEALLAGSGGSGIAPIIDTGAMRPMCVLPPFVASCSSRLRLVEGEGERYHSAPVVAPVCSDNSAASDWGVRSISRGVAGMQKGHQRQLTAQCEQYRVLPGVQPLKRVRMICN